MSTTTALTIDQWLEASRSGMSDDRLAEVFDLVKPDGHWKLPIAARVPVADATAEEISTAIDWYAGGGATVEPIRSTDTGEQTAWWVEAPGYFEMVGA